MKCERLLNSAVRCHIPAHGGDVLAGCELPSDSFADCISATECDGFFGSGAGRVKSHPTVDPKPVPCPRCKTWSRTPPGEMTGSGAPVPPSSLPALEKRNGLPQLGELVNDVVGLHLLGLLPALVGGKEDGLHADPAGAVNVTVHVVAHEKHVFR